MVLAVGPQELMSTKHNAQERRRALQAELSSNWNGAIY